ncbi:hypothetical protein SAMN02982989_2684 [Xaviernesmea oryzae]|uniref:Uncharacterized protein n=1 Tax=Xaviernesmea oryzae TaxID=464029 RepID=A0A1X7FCP2_9HYPH|nr:hypothetical protein SAMN02982989_2684 [Xaviernesmea oryzae]
MTRAGRLLPFSPAGRRCPAGRMRGGEAQIRRCRACRVCTPSSPRFARHFSPLGRRGRKPNWLGSHMRLPPPVKEVTSSGLSPSPQRGEGGPQDRMRGAKPPSVDAAFAACAPPHRLASLGTSPRWGEEEFVPPASSDNQVCYLACAGAGSPVVWGRRRSHPISPLEGEMPGRAEGGDATHTARSFRLS